MKNKKIIIFSAPSGAGKTTIIKYILNEFSNIAFSISATSREKRSEEIDGKDYYFFSKDNFEEKIKNNAFLEWEEVYKGTYYGTLLSEVYRIWSEDKNIIFDIDIKGALNIKKLFPKNSILIFVEPPSIEVLEERLKKRNTETKETLQKRIGKAIEELSYKDNFDFIITNDILENAKNKVKKIVTNFIK